MIDFVLRKTGLRYTIVSLNMHDYGSLDANNT